jgi:ATP-dependent Clp protease adaptor protein ClpS
MLQYKQKVGSQGEVMGIHEDTTQRTKEKTGLEIKKPPLYRVFLLNDDYTTMDFVVHVLQGVFHKSSVEATQIMLHVHKNGKGLAGIYTKEIAETKVGTVHKLAREQEFPLKCSMEKE